MAEQGWNVSRRNVPGLNHAGQRLHNPTAIACRLCDHVFMTVQALMNHVESHMMEAEASARRQRRASHISFQRNPFLNSFQPNFSLTTPAREAPPQNRSQPVTSSPPPERSPFPGVDRILAQHQTLPPHVSAMARPGFSHAPQLAISAPQGQSGAVEEPPSNHPTPYPAQLNRFPPVQSSPQPERYHLCGVNGTLAPKPTLQPHIPAMAGNNVSHAPASVLSASQDLSSAGEEPPSVFTEPYLDQLEYPITAVVEVSDSDDDNNSTSSLNKLDLALKL